jgi:signal peptidase I
MLSYKSSMEPELEKHKVDDAVTVDKKRDNNNDIQRPEEEDKQQQPTTTNTLL